MLYMGLAEGATDVGGMKNRCSWCKRASGWNTSWDDSGDVGWGRSGRRVDSH